MRKMFVALIALIGMTLSALGGFHTSKARQETLAALNAASEAFCKTGCFQSDCDRMKHLVSTLYQEPGRATLQDLAKLDEIKTIFAKYQKQAPLALEHSRQSIAAAIDNAIIVTAHVVHDHKGVWSDHAH